MQIDQKTLNETLRRVFLRLHHPVEIILTCVRWYAAYPLSLRQLEEMIAERGVAVDHSTIHRWAIKMRFCRDKVMRPSSSALDAMIKMRVSRIGSLQTRLDL